MTSASCRFPSRSRPFGETSNAIIVGAFPIWRPLALLLNSLAERSTKRLALNPADREQRARIIREWLQTEAHYLA
jgi:hypothetical protein